MYRFFLGASRFMAHLGGLVLVAIILMVCLSILGRTLNQILHSDAVSSLAPGISTWLLGAGVGPITGDYELLEAGIAFVIFAFLPLCQITGGHASVDIIVTRFPMGVQRGLQLVTDIAFAVALAIIAWKLEEGMASKLRSGQTTFLLQFPIWWAYALSLFAALIAAAVGAYVALARGVEVLTGREILAQDPGAEH